MKIGIAETAEVPSSPKVYLGRRQIRYDLKRRKLLEGLAELTEVIDGKTKFITWAARHPRTAAFAIRRGLVKWKPFAEEASEEERAEDRASLQGLAEAADAMDEEVFERSKVMGALAAVDRSLLSPIYLRKSPFVRLQLRPFYAESDSLSDREVMVLLLLHRSGTALLTFHTVAGDRTTDELLKISSGKGAKLKSCVFDEAIVGPELADKAVESPLSSGDGISVTDVFLMHRDRIERVLRRQDRTGDYFCYTTVLVGGIRCCRTRQRWFKLHARELAGLVMRYPPYGRIKDQIVAEVQQKDKSVGSETSRYYCGGNAFVIDWDYDYQEPCVSFVNVVNTVVIIENALLQYWQISSLHETLLLEGRSRRSLLQAQEELARGLEEFGASSISYGTAQEISADILRQLHTDRLHQRLTERLGLAQQLLDSVQVQQAARRNYLLAGMGSLATLLFGIPALKESLEVIASWRPPENIGFAAEPIINWAKGGPTAIISAYTVIILSAFFVLVFGFLLRKPRGRVKEPSQVGVEWTPFSPAWSSKEPRYVGGRPMPEPTTEGDGE
ncbi:hypothetical protein AB0877_13910 [Micromonospora sp. NPDC047644]|uniref:hypothetical protein n=1 Tax=Micromonospora sp. NPDC047644 TaxID=3157203 RepID=UPI003453C057